jgi:hypothetical protein
MGTSAIASPAYLLDYCNLMTADDYRLMTANVPICETQGAAPKMLTATNDKVRVHPASPIVIVAVQ